MSVLFSDARFSTGARPRSRSNTGMWLSVVVHATFAGVLMAIVPTRASEKSPMPPPRSIGVFRWRAAEPVALRSIPVEAPRLPSPPRPSPPVPVALIAEAPKPAAIAPIAARSVEAAPANLLAAAATTLDRPVERALPERPPETGLFERANGPRAPQAAASITTGGFGSAVASSHAAANGADDVQTAGFDRRASAAVQPSAAVAPKAIDRPVEILFKPSPEYTDEARRVHVEGTVTLDLEFTAAGDVRVLRVVRGLGYGLDESAERAASRIRFKPAQSDGRAVDSRATVYITFRLS